MYTLWKVIKVINPKITYIGSITFLSGLVNSFDQGASIRLYLKLIFYCHSTRNGPVFWHFFGEC